jgi:multidrug resistance efflux pump
VLWDDGDAEPEVNHAEDGYFEGTKLPRIHIGDPAHAQLMGETQWLAGHVESMAGGIEDRERATSGGTLLANVNPTFTWVRLAQRIPVRIKLDSPSPDIRLIAGRTATVLVGRSDGKDGTRSSPR